MNDGMPSRAARVLPLTGVSIIGIVSHAAWRWSTVNEPLTRHVACAEVLRRDGSLRRDAASDMPDPRHAPAAAESEHPAHICTRTIRASRTAAAATTPQARAVIGKPPRRGCRRTAAGTATTMEESGK